MKLFFSAWSFLTVFPCPGKSVDYEKGMVFYFPLVGLVLGILLLGVDFLAGRVFGDSLRIGLDVLFLAWVSGGLHLDGLADSADGMFSHQSKDRVLEIMRDSRIGVMGVLAIVFCLGFKAVGFESLRWDQCWWLFLAAPALSRWTQSCGLVFLSNARGEESLGALLYQSRKYRVLSLGIIPSALFCFFGGLKGIFLLLGFMLVLIVLFRYFSSKIGGMTGDTLGATTEITESFLFAFGSLACRDSLIFN